jgi:hypothetical protein
MQIHSRRAPAARSATPRKDTVVILPDREHVFRIENQRTSQVFVFSGWNNVHSGLSKHRSIAPSATRNGSVKFFNAQYRRRREAASARGRGFHDL